MTDSTADHPTGTDAAINPPEVTPVPARRMLVLATVGFLVNFWAWALISPLGASYHDQLKLSAFQQAFLVAVPVVVGSSGAFPSVR